MAREQDLSGSAWWRSHALLIGAATAGVVGVLVVVLITWNSGEDEKPDPRARQYLDVTACLLTDDKGIAGAAAAPVWAGMQDASAATRAKVQYLAVAGEQTPQNAGTFLASLAQGRCTVIVAVGAAPVAAVEPTAKQFPKLDFVVVGGKAGNVRAVAATAPADVRAEVRDLITAKVRGQK